MSTRIRKSSLGTLMCTVAALAFMVPAEATAQSGPSPYRLVDDWAQLPDGRPMGAVGKVTMDPDGDHLWAVIRCDARGFDVTPSRFGNECVDSDLDPVIKFDLDGNVVESFGGGLFIWPHGIDVDPGRSTSPPGARRKHASVNTFTQRARQDSNLRPTD